MRPSSAIGHITRLLHAAALALVSTLAMAAAGDLDPTFGERGVHTPAAECCGFAGVGSVIVQPDGGVLVAGYAENGALDEATVVRFHFNGAVDPRFGIGGVSRIAVGDLNASVTSIALQPDGKIVGAAVTYDSTRTRHSFVFRLDATGNPDASFGAGGVSLVGPLLGGSTRTEVRRVLLQPDGRIVVAGGLTYPDTTTEMFAARLGATGALDEAFGNGGVMVGGLAGRSEGRDAALGPDGGIYVVGDASVAGNVQNALMRLTASGERDAGFGSGGVKAPLLSGPATLRSIAIQADGRVLVGGRVDDRAAVARVSAAGVLDGSYGAGGIRALETAASLDRAVHRLVPVAGEQALALVRSGSGDEVRRLLADGSDDPSWMVSALKGADLAQGNGVAAVGFSVATGFYGVGLAEKSSMSVRTLAMDGSAGPQSDVFPALKRPLGDFLTLAIDAAGRILTVRSNDVQRYPSTYLTRLTTEGREDPAFGSNGRVIASSGVPNAALIVKPNGKIMMGSTSSGSLAQLHADGSADAGFTTPENKPYERPVFLLPLADNRVVFGSATYVGRFLDDGRFDPAFNGGQYIDTSLAHDFTSGALLPDGRLVLSRTDASIEMRDAGGSIDPAFGTGGRVPLRLDTHTYIGKMLVQRDGRILVAGVTYHPTPEGPWSYALFVARMHPDGALDAGFGSAGVARRQELSTTAPAVRGLALQDDGKVLVSGVEDQARTAEYSFGGSGAFAWRLNPDGGADGSFGPDGFRRIDSSRGVDTANEVHVQPGGRILVAGSSLGVKSIVALLPGESIASSTAEPQIARYYRTILGREAEAGGLAFWKSEFARLVAGGGGASETFYVMAMAFFSSAEYAQKNASDRDYVTDLYRTFFDREPDAPGLDHWAGQLAAGQPRGAVLASFLFSPEFANFMGATFGGANAGRPETSLVTDLYRGLLHRLPDPDGLNHWVQRLRAAQCTSTVAVEADAMSALFSESEEYRIGQAALSTPFERNAAFVVDLYDALMKRGPDLEGLRFHAGRLDSGAATRAEVRRQFLESPEFQLRLLSVQRVCRL